MKRSFDPAVLEMMDRPQPVSHELERDLERLRQLNRWFGSYRLVSTFIRRWITPGAKMRVEKKKNVWEVHLSIYASTSVCAPIFAVLTIKRGRSPEPEARSATRIFAPGVIQRRMKVETRRWLPNQRLSCRSRSRSRSNSWRNRLRPIHHFQNGRVEAALHQIKGRAVHTNRPGTIEVNRPYPETYARTPATPRSLRRSRCVPRIRVGKSCWFRKP